ncbi:uncharacterized protein LOC127915630 [Oncorhynchus keta]|nr:uncharacterized protein LOC127915630 [Oncorhynchus keta]
MYQVPIKGWIQSILQKYHGRSAFKCKDEISRLVTAGRPTTCPLDPIPSSLLQTISGDLLPYLTSLIKSSLTAGYVPSVFKRARVAPLLKKPTLDPSDVNNYRPVSLLSFISKTLERAVLGQLSLYLSQNDLLDPNQSGFKTSHSTETALLCITEALRTAKANSLSSALILLDLSAAFDTVNHQILLSTLSELGISGAAHAWIASYLTGRSYQVANRISACLADISVWMTDHHLKLNLGKTELLFLPGKDCPFHDLAITVDNSIVSSSQSAKNLGVILDNALSFSTNIKAVARSCRFMLYNIRRVRPCGYVWYIGYFSALMVCVLVLTVSCVLVHRFRDQQRERQTHFWVAAIEQGAVTQHPLLHWIDVNRHLSLSVIVKGDARGKQEEDREEGEEGKKEEGAKFSTPHAVEGRSSLRLTLLRGLLTLLRGEVLSRLTLLRGEVLYASRC